MTHLRKFLADTDTTQAAFAERVGVNQATISKLCGMKPQISADLAVKIERETAGAVPVESWPNFEPLLHRTPHAAGCARMDLPEYAEDAAVGRSPDSLENLTGPDAP